MHIATSYLYMFESENVSTLCESTWISVDKMMVQKHIFLSQADLARTGIISNSYNEMFEA
jgi:hypothetical protein